MMSAALCSSNIEQSNVQNWSEEDVSNWLESLNLSDDYSSRIKGKSLFVPRMSCYNMDYSGGTTNVMSSETESSIERAFAVMLSIKNFNQFFIIIVITEMSINGEFLLHSNCTTLSSELCNYYSI